MDSLTAKLRLCYLIIMERHKMDFGDSVAALIISFVQLKLLMAATKRCTGRKPTMMITTPVSEPFKNTLKASLGVG